MSVQQCAENQLHFQGLGTRKIVCAFDGGTITSDARGLLLRETRYAEHPLRQLLALRFYGLCLGYEDLNDHEQLRYDPIHGSEEGWFFNGFYNCDLQLYIFCGGCLLAAKLRRSNIDASHGAGTELADEMAPRAPGRLSLWA